MKVDGPHPVTIVRSVGEQEGKKETSSMVNMSNPKSMAEQGEDTRKPIRRVPTELTEGKNGPWAKKLSTTNTTNKRTKSR